MKWIHNYQLFLFDFDGLLVDTERAHYNAYRRMCAHYGFELGWSFKEYCGVAFVGTKELRAKMVEAVPGLKEFGWGELYPRKTAYCLEELRGGNLELMPGVERLLYALEEKGIERCVVTNSSREMIDILRGKIEVLNTIPHWITREDYEKSKPDPEAYQLAVERFGKEGVIGFEDTVKGLKALKAVIDRPVLICDPTLPQMESEEVKGVQHFTSFEDIPDQWS